MCYVNACVCLERSLKRSLEDMFSPIFFHSQIFKGPMEEQIWKGRGYVKPSLFIFYNIYITHMIIYRFHIISGKLKSQLSRIFPFCKCLEETVEPLHREQENRILIYMITRTIMFILSSATMTNLDKCEFGGKIQGLILNSKLLYIWVKQIFL